MLKALKNLLILLPFLCNGQSLGRFVTDSVLNHPEQVIEKLRAAKPGSAWQAGISYYRLGKCYAFLNHEDAALAYFIKAKKQFETAGKTTEAKDIALEAHLVVSSQDDYQKYGYTFLEEYKAYAHKTKSAERLALVTSEYAKEAYQTYSEADDPDVKVLDSALALFQKALVYAQKSGNRAIEGKICLNLATINNTAGRYKEALAFADKALSVAYYVKDPLEQAKGYYTIGNTFFMQENYKEALFYFKKALAIKMPYYQKFGRLIYKKIAQCYDALGDNANRRRFETAFDSLDAKIKDVEQNIAIHDINIKYQVAEKDRQISILQNIKMKFIQHKIIFGTLLFLVFLLALYSFIRWRKVDVRRKKLQQEKEGIETEHTKTVEQLEKVRQLVIEDHIILKNKTRLYLDKLMYIKADDHYLNFTPSEGKGHFLRGKLSEIEKELPPNFIKCHRSYIVNTNFIKSSNSKGILLKNGEELPVSRNFKL
ncbi:LytTR family transcriptional regulator [Flavobacterium akiainvivens]|uniref:LytTR family transcriptional regulator n=1 Tax=Flavobacterium akiainvivens TaxID=1202724 RepID=UPI0006C87458|nr:LytTR family transcriptional regulator [Flavobacterium akiainvivens]SFQ11004.1 DNA-binding response regulator, LytR/AlgR family [Flavobacterium akiainvivens]